MYYADFDSVRVLNRFRICPVPVPNRFRPCPRLERERPIKTFYYFKIKALQSKNFKILQNMRSLDILSNTYVLTIMPKLNNGIIIISTVNATSKLIIQL